MSWQLIAWIVAGLIGLGAAARWQRLGEVSLADPNNAARLAEALLVGFHARQALPGGNGAAALVAGNGTLALLTRRGLRVAARRLIAPLALVPSEEGIAVQDGNGSVALFGVTDDQVRALEALSQRPTVH